MEEHRDEHDQLLRMKHDNYIRRARLVKQIVDAHYEPGSQRGCLRYIWRVYVNPVYPMSMSSFYRMVEFMQGVDGYVGTGRCRVSRPQKLPVDVQAVQLSLF